jgi:hypothetical protein
MAIYHFSARAVRRAAGHSAARAIGYQLGERLSQEGKLIPKWLVSDAEKVVAKGIVGWDGDAQNLATAIDAAERVNARLGHSIDAALPHEIDTDERTRLARGMALKLSDQTGAAVTWAVHCPSEAGDARNWHAHFFVAPKNGRTLESYGGKSLPHTRGKEGIEWIQGAREEWGHRVNRSLERAGSTSKVSHLSHAERGIPLTPTLHEGAKFRAISRAGYETQIKKKNEQIQRNDREILDLVRTHRELTGSARRACERTRERERKRAVVRNSGSRMGAGIRNKEIKTDSGSGGNMARWPMDAARERERQTRIGRLRNLWDELKKIDLRKIAAAHGWFVDRDGGAKQMRRADGSSEIVISQVPDGRWVYFSRASGKGGSVIDFLATEIGIAPKDVSKYVSGLTLAEPASMSFRSTLDRREPEPKSQLVDPKKTHTWLMEERGFSRATLEFFADSIKAAPNGRAEFAHVDGGAEIRGENFKGAKAPKSFWLHKPARKIYRVIVCESALDCMAYHELYDEQGVAFVSLAGGTSPEVLERVASLAASLGAEIGAATDADEAGEILAEAIAEAGARAGVTVVRERPSAVDWNDQLRGLSA